MNKIQELEKIIKESKKYLKKTMNINIRQETEWKKTCQWCKWFTSYQDEYEDELELPDFGRCNNESNLDKDECFGDGLTCDLFERAGNAL